MKITTIKYMERKNLGNYEHQEIAAEAVIDEGETVEIAMMSLKNLVHDALNGMLGKSAKVTPEEVLAATKNMILPHEAVEKVTAELVTRGKSKTKKATRAKKDAVATLTTVTTEEVVVESSVPSTETVVTEDVKKEKPKKVTKYSSEIQEHKSIFGAYLAKKYGDAWKVVKPAAEIKAFTASLNGEDFLNDQGGMVESFFAKVHGFFGEV